VVRHLPPVILSDRTQVRESRVEILPVAHFSWVRRSALHGAWEGSVPDPLMGLALASTQRDFSALHREGNPVVGGEKPQGGQRDSPEYLSSSIG
jgi:hypothetical protein